jgi:hypothetical protein
MKVQIGQGFQAFRSLRIVICERSEAIQTVDVDCFVAVLLAMTR